MKKAISIFLFVCLIIPLSGSFIWFHFQRYEIRKESKRVIKSGLAKEDLVLFAIKKEAQPNNLRWVHDNEFEFNGHMYDVVTKEVKGDTVLYWCYQDHMESQLNNRIKVLLAKAVNNHPTNKDNQQRLISFLKALYITDHFSWKPDISDLYFRYLQAHSEACSSGFHKPNSPPPELS